MRNKCPKRGFASFIVSFNMSIFSVIVKSKVTTFQGKLGVIPTPLTFGSNWYLYSPKAPPECGT